MPTMLFCNIARMDSYRGRTSVDVPHGAGRNRAKEEVHNFHPYGAHVYGYVAAPNRSIDLEKLGADNKEQLAVGGVDVIWTAPSPGGGRYVVGWYRDATVFRNLQEYERGLYHVQASKTDYVLLPPKQARANHQECQSSARWVWPQRMVCRYGVRSEYLQACHRLVSPCQAPSLRSGRTRRPSGCHREA